jgi:hypothetical protein
MRWHLYYFYGINTTIENNAIQAKALVLCRKYLEQGVELISNVCVARRATGSSLSNNYTRVIDLELETNPSITAIFARYSE